jgi:hypothetical protein
MATTPTGMFQEPPQERSFPTTAVAIAATAIVILVIVLVALGRRHGGAQNQNTLQPLAAYAPQLALSNLQMSESTSLSGGKSTYIDGHITNNGASTVTGITVQVVFSGPQPPQLETAPLQIIRIRQPEVDTEPVSAAPLAPGAGADFRLIFEDVSPDWNQQTPQIRVIGVEK